MKVRSLGLFFGVLSSFACFPALAQAKQLPPANRVTLQRARETAVHAYPGKVQGEELEFEGGKWIYSFDLKNAGDKRVHEVHVDALSGLVLDIHAESAADELKEKREDQKESSGT